MGVGRWKLGNSLSSPGGEGRGEEAIELRREERAGEGRHLAISARPVASAGPPPQTSPRLVLGGGGGRGGGRGEHGSWKMEVGKLPLLPWRRGSGRGGH